MVADVVLPVNLRPDVRMLAALVAAVGSIVSTIFAAARPALELYEMGVSAGRRELLIEQVTQRAGRAVVPFRPRRGFRGQAAGRRSRTTR